MSVIAWRSTLFKKALMGTQYTWQPTIKILEESLLPLDYPWFILGSRVWIKGGGILYGDGPQAPQASGPSLIARYMTPSSFLDL